MMKKHFTVSNKVRSSALLLMMAILLLPGLTSGQTNNYFGTSGTLSGNVWSTNPAGPYTSALVTTGGPILNFNNTGSATSASIATTVGINFGAAVTWSAGGTIGAASINLPINVAGGVNQDYGASQSFSTSVSAAFTKNGNGSLGMAGGTFGGGFTLNAGTLVARGVNAMGGNATPGTLTLNGGTIAANATRDFTGKYSSITIGGDVQFGEVAANVPLASGASNLTFSNNMSLGSSVRTLTLGGSGNITFGGIISNVGSSGIVFSANANGTGSFILTGANTYSGTTIINSGIVRLNRAGGTTLPVVNDVSVVGGTLRVSTNQTLNNLTVDDLGSVIVDDGVTLTITGTLNLSFGKITLGTGNVIAENITGGSSDSYVVTGGTGALIRNVATGTSPTVFFPVGTSTIYRPATVVYTANTSATGTLSGRFVATAPTTTGLPLANEQGVPSITNVSPSGYWSVVSSAVLGGTYTMTVDATDFLKSDNATPITSLFGVRLIKRSTGGSWALSGSTTTTDPASLNAVSADGFINFSDFGVGGPDAALPVEVVNFDAKLDKGKVVTFWTTASERNNSHFEIERSVDGKSFLQIGRVTGAGDSDETKNYTFSDGTPARGLNYYRLKQVDLDGKFAYSMVRTISFGKSGNVLLFPAPTNETLNVQLEETFATDAQWQIIDMAGRVLSTGTLAGEQQTFQIPVSTLVEGAYLLRIVADQQVLTQQFRKN